jgi:hypothetical protein
VSNISIRCIVLFLLACLFILALTWLLWQNLLSVYQVIEILVSLMGVAIAYSLYRVASSSLQAARKDRKLRLLDAKLQKAYYPIFEILRSARFGKPRGAGASQTVLYDLEKRDIGNIRRKYVTISNRNLKL